MVSRVLTVLLVFTAFTQISSIQAQTIKPLRTIVEMNIGDSTTAVLHNGQKVTVALLSSEVTRDEFHNAVRKVRMQLRVNGEEITINNAGYYELPVTVAGVQLDIPITKDFEQGGPGEWHLSKYALVRMWPEGSPQTNPGTFVFPVNQRFLASDMQLGNEPAHIGPREDPAEKTLYYHAGTDFGGAEGMVDVYAAADGVVVSKAGEIWEGFDPKGLQEFWPRYELFYLQDDRGWVYRYSHLKSHETNVILGERVLAGQKIGEMGKEGASRGWVHLHFDIHSLLPSGQWCSEPAYAYVWEAYVNQYKPKMIAVARPHQLAAVGDKVILDGSKSVSYNGDIVSYEWICCDGTRSFGAVFERTYDRAGFYTETLKVVNKAGDIEYDFCPVNIIDKNHTNLLPPIIHLAYAPSFNIQPGDPVTFKGRSFRTRVGRETWDFGDGSPAVTTESNPGGNPPVNYDGASVKKENEYQTEGEHAEDGYATVIHRYAKPGKYIVRVERVNEHGLKGIAHLIVRVGK